MRKAGMLLLPGGLALGVFAATAIAAGGIKVVKSTTAANPGPNTQAVECPGHNQILGGGFSSPFGSIGQKSKPTGAYGWKAEVLDQTGAGDFTTYAICNTAADRRLKRVAGKVTVPPPSNPDTPFGKGVTAKCPSGWQVISGGYQVKPKYSGGSDGEIAVDTSMRKNARTWAVHGSNFGDPTMLMAFALCERAGKTQIDQAQDTTDATSQGEETTATATCDRGTHLVGGGFRTEATETGEGVASAVNVSKPVDSDGWRASAASEGPTPTLASVTSYAECEQG